ncbi:MAG: hypothetical protein DRI90_14410 [Deltaproteobacteria bacterium]|nr:MAG: hypothetical protein DRI90_14410 [Deltaproteobacteria bacterium]
MGVGSDKPEWDAEGLEWGGDGLESEVDEPERSEFEELVEIERATAMLRGLDPDQAEDIVAARFAAGSEQLARAEHTDEIRTEIEKKTRRRRRLIIMAVAGVFVVGATAVPVSRAIRAALAQAEVFRLALSKAGEPLADSGFQQQDEWLDLSESGASFDVSQGTCSAVIGLGADGTEAGPLRIERPSAVMEGAWGQIWCSCSDERVVVRPAPGTEGRVAARWWTVGADEVGGVEVLRAAAIAGFSVNADQIDLACADPSFAKWTSSEGRGSPPPLPPKPTGVTAKLLAAGFEPVGGFPTSRTFVVLRHEAKRCVLAVPQGAPGTLSLRAADGTRLITDTAAALAWCSYGKEGLFSLWRSGAGAGDGGESGASGDYAVLSIPAERVGGMAGLRELTGSQGLESLATVLGGADLTADAVAALEASTVPIASSVRAVNGSLAKKLGHRVVAFSQLEAGAFVVDTSPEARLACSPKQDTRATVNAFVCVQAQAQGWRGGGTEAVQAAASGPLPAWLKLLADVRDPEVVDVMAQLLRLARHMAAQGSEPTTTDGVEESVRGATISGRPHKTEVVAVGLTKTRPWVHPLTDDQPWTLAGSVHAVKVTPGGYVKLKASRSLGYNAASRRVVVWRR